MHFGMEHRIEKPLFSKNAENIHAKTATTLKSNAKVAYTVHIIPLKFTANYRRYFIAHGHTLVVMLPVSISKSEYEKEDLDCGANSKMLTNTSIVALIDKLPATFHQNGRDIKFEITSNSMQRLDGACRLYYFRIPGSYILDGLDLSHINRILLL